MQAVAKLRNLPISPRKVRLVADLVRGASVARGLAILKHTSKKCATHLEKLLLSAIANWESKNEGESLEDANLSVKAVWVDSAGMLKRIKAAPQGRAHRIRKRSSHITLIVDAKHSATEDAKAPNVRDGAEAAVQTAAPKHDAVSTDASASAKAQENKTTES